MRVGVHEAGHDEETGAVHGRLPRKPRPDFGNLGAVKAHVGPFKDAARSILCQKDADVFQEHVFRNRATALYTLYVPDL